MKKIIILLAIFTTFATMAQSVGINADGSAANASAMLDVSSTTKGFLPPRMTGAQRNAIASPVPAGLLVLCTDCGISGEIQVYNGTTWTNLIDGTATAATPRVTIGTQVWAVHNLDVTTYRDGTPIPEVTDPAAWTALTTGAWCYYNNNSSLGTTYGKLYNWYAVAGIHDADPNTPNKVLAPTGWHVPTDSEWTTLTTTLGGTSVAGGKMKVTTLWNSPNTNASNISGFSGVPGGYRSNNGTFSGIGTNGSWWSSSDFSTTYAWARGLSYNSYIASRFDGHKISGLSVRCLRD
jgi:uncharacterized protein (TIGR02145 family)